MENQPLSNSAPEPVLGSRPEIRIFGVGTAGMNILERLATAGIPAGALFAVGSDSRGIQSSTAGEKLVIDSRPARGLASGGSPERAQEAAEEQLPRLKCLCEGARFVFVIAGLGGGLGTGAAPVLAATAREAGAVVIGFSILPFEFEGNLRTKAAQVGLYRLKAAADLTVCFENQRTFGSLEENTGLADTYKRSDGCVTESVLGTWHALQSESLMGLTFTDVCAIMRERSGECRFAFAEASGPNRVSEVLDKLGSHPMFDASAGFADLDTLAVWIFGGVALGPVEVNRVMEQVRHRCDSLPLLMGAAVSPSQGDKLQVGLLAVCRDQPGEPQQPAPAAAASATHSPESHFLNRSATPRSGSRFVAPAPEATPERLEQLRKPRKAMPRFRQAQLPLEIVSKGRFDKSEPTIHKGEDLDVPTYLRRGIQLN